VSEHHQANKLTKNSMKIMFYTFDPKEKCRDLLCIGKEPVVRDKGVMFPA